MTASGRIINDREISRVKFFKKENIFTDVKRKQLLKMSKPLLVNHYNDSGMKGLSTHPDLYKIPGFDFYVKKIKTLIEEHYQRKFNIVRAWCRYTQGDHINFHRHPNVNLTSSYYLQNPSELGTLARTDNKEIHLGGKENSLVAFDASIFHSVPTSTKKMERYTFITDLQNV